MRSLIRWFVRGILMLAALIAFIVFFGPRDRLDWGGAKNPAEGVGIGEIDAYLAQAEAQFADIKRGQAKQVIWAGAPGQKTQYAVVYIHGFSASSGEIRPVPDRLAESLGANLFYTRLAGHGRTGEAMTKARLSDWAGDLLEAIAIGKLIGEKVIIIGTSTGATLISAALGEAEIRDATHGVIFISPNFGVLSPLAFLADWPFFRVWGPMIAGETRSFEPENALHAALWTTSYPTISVVPMMALIREALKIDYGSVGLPALFLYSPEDRVVDAAKTGEIAERWGGSVKVMHPDLAEEDDPYRHVIAGDALSAGQNASMGEAMRAWIEGLP